jgi:hypothetical protein
MTQVFGLDEIRCMARNWSEDVTPLGIRTVKQIA